MKVILFISITDDILKFLEPPLTDHYLPVVVTPTLNPELPGRDDPIQLVAVSGYSLREASGRIPGLEAILATLPPRLPHLYLLHETDPSLSLVPLKGEQRFFYLRGPLSSRALSSAIDQILTLKPRARRIPIGPDQKVRVKFTAVSLRDGPSHYDREVLEISPAGLSFHWLETDPLLYPGDILENLTLSAQSNPFLVTSAMVRHLTLLPQAESRRGMRVGVEFVDRRSTSPDGIESRGRAFLSDSVVIKTVLFDAVERHALVQIRGEHPGWELHGSLLECDEVRQSLRIGIQASDLPMDLEEFDIVSCQFVRDNAQLQFWTVVMVFDRSTESLTLRFPKRLDKLWARSTLRYEFGDEAAPRVEIMSPVLPEQSIVRDAVNLSPHGVCVEVDPHEDLLLRGMRLSDIRLTLGSGQCLRARGEVRYLVSKGAGMPARAQCGIQFEKMSPSDQHALVDYLIAKNYPEVGDATYADADDLWKFMLDADFYTPAKQDVCLGTPEEVRLTQEAMLKASPPFSRKLIFRDHGKIYGTVSLQQIGQRTWLVHHLCAVRHRSQFVPKSLLLFLGEYISKTPEIEYIKMMWRPNNTWSNRMFGRLVHRLHDGEQSVVKVHSYLHHDGAPLPSPSAEVAAWTIRPISSEEVGQLESYFIHQEEYFLMKSEDLYRGGLEFESLRERYAALGLTRDRKVLAAFDGGRLAGFVLAERASPGLNMSNLLNTFQVFLCYPEATAGEVLKEALIRAALSYYHEHGQDKAVAFSEDSDLSCFLKLGFIKKKEYVCWTFDHNIANIYNLYCYYIFRVYERLEARRQELRTRPIPPPDDTAENSVRLS